MASFTLTGRSTERVGQPSDKAFRPEKLKSKNDLNVFLFYFSVRRKLVLEKMSFFVNFD